MTPAAEWELLCRDRLQRAQRLSESMPVVGVVGSDLPRLVVDAQGISPFYLVPDGTAASAEAIELLGDACHRAVAQILTQILDGKLDFLAGLVITRESQDLVRLFYVLRMLRKQERLPFPLHYAELLHTNNSATTAYNTYQLDAVSLAAHAWAEPFRMGQQAEDQSALMDAWNAQEALENCITGRRADGNCLGSDVIATLLEVSALPLQTALTLVEKWRPEAPDEAIPVILTGSRHWTYDLYRKLESQGLNVVAEDHAGGHLAYTFNLGPFPDNRPHLTLAESVARWGPAAATSSQHHRADHLSKLLNQHHPSAVIATIDCRDQSAVWDLRLQEKVCKNAGIPFIIVKSSGGSDENSAGLLDAAISTLLEVSA